MADAEVKALNAATKRLAIDLAVVGQAGGQVIAAARLAQIDQDVQTLNQDLARYRDTLARLAGEIAALQPERDQWAAELQVLGVAGKRRGWQIDVLTSLGNADGCRADHLEQIKGDRKLPVLVMPVEKRLQREIELIPAVCPSTAFPDGLAATTSHTRCDEEYKKLMATQSSHDAATTDEIRAPGAEFEAWQRAIVPDCDALRDRLSTRLKRLSAGGAPETSAERAADEPFFNALNTAPAGTTGGSAAQSSLAKFKSTQKIVNDSLLLRRDELIATLNKTTRRFQELDGKLRLAGEGKGDTERRVKKAAAGLQKKDLERRQAGEDHARISRADSIQAALAACDRRYCTCAAIHTTCKDGPCEPRPEL